MWHQHHEMSVEEIAEQLGLTTHQVKHHLRSGLRKLKDGRANKIRELYEAREQEYHGEARIFVDQEDGDYKLKNLTDWLRLLAIIA